MKAWARLAVLLIVPGAAFPPAHAQTWPAKAVRIIVPFPAGAGADVTLRLFTPRLAETLGQQVVVDNRSGAAGNTGAQAAARAAPDGYTFLNAPASLASSPSLYRNLGFDLARDFDGVAMLAAAPFILAVHPSVPAKSVKELIALARAQPGRLTFASTGVGGTNHLAAELFKSIAQIDILHVPYKGTATALPDLLGGQVAMMFTSTVSSLPQVKAGRLRALGVSSARRSLAAPDLPTLAEAGVPGYEFGTWFVLLAPAGTPRDIVTRLNAAVAKVAQLPEVRDQLIAQGSEPLSGTPADVQAFVASEIAKLGRIIAAAGVRAE